MQGTDWEEEGDEEARKGFEQRLPRAHERPKGSYGRVCRPQRRTGRMWHGERAGAWVGDEGRGAGSGQFRRALPRPSRAESGLDALSDAPVDHSDLLKVCRFGMGLGEAGGRSRANFG
jgi:hypothetical protein